MRTLIALAALCYLIKDRAFTTYALSDRAVIWFIAGMLLIALAQDICWFFK